MQIKSEHEKRLPVIYALFFISGAAGLLYEIIWTRILVLSMGQTVYAITTILASFMGGLALGSWLLGKWADKTTAPLKLYAILEIAVGITCLATPLLLELSRDVYLHLYPFLEERIALRVFTQFLLSGAVLIPPTFLMGGTLPVMSRLAIRNPVNTSLRVGLLYGSNTLGAATGAFATGYLLIPYLDLRMVNLIGVSLSFLTGAVALMLSRKYSSSSIGLPVTVQKTAFSGKTLSPWQKRTILATLLVSGGLGMLYEIMWTRTLVQILGSSVYAFSAILVVFLVGLGSGSALYPLLRRMESPCLLAILQTGIAVTASFLVPVFESLPRLFLAMMRNFEGSYNYVQFVQFAVVFVVTILPTMLMGMVFPLASGLLSPERSNLGRGIGRYYAINTFGAIAGSLLAGFFLLPGVGAQGTLRMGITGNLILAFAILLFAPTGKKAALRFTMPLVPVIIFLAMNMAWFQWDQMIMATGVPTRPDYFLQNDRVPTKQAILSGKEILYFGEGPNATVVVTQAENGSKALWINGKADASTTPSDMQTQIKLAYIPLMIHPEPSNIAVIGAGAGITAGVANLFSKPRHILVLELEPAVVESTKIFSRENYNLLNSRRVRYVLDDARTYLEATSEKFDIIISEPSNPWVMGVSNLYTDQFFARVKSRLSNKGVFVQWLHGYSIDIADFKMILRTFMKSFPKASLWAGGVNDYLLVGRGVDAKTIDLVQMLENFQESSDLKLAFPLFQGRELESLLDSFLLDEEELRQLSGQGPTNTDFRNRLEFRAPLYLYSDSANQILTAIKRVKSHSYPDFMAQLVETNPDLHEKLGRYFLERGRFEEAVFEFSRMPDDTPAALSGYSETTEHPSGAISDPISYIHENFESEDQLVFIPALGAYRPEEEENLSIWSAYLVLFERFSGITLNKGYRGSSGLVLKSLKDINAVGLYANLDLAPSSRYRFDLWVRADLPELGSAGIGTYQLNTDMGLEKQPTQETIEKHVIERLTHFKYQETSTWEKRSFNLNTRPDTKMVQLVLFLQGPSSKNSVYLDELKVTRVR